LDFPYDEPVLVFTYTEYSNIFSIYDQKNGRKRKLREDEIVNPTSRPVYKWRAERKR